MARVTNRQGLLVVVEEDIVNCEFTVSPEVYIKHRGHIYEVIDDVDLNRAFFLLQMMDEPPGNISNTDCLIRCEKRYDIDKSAHLCYMVVREAAKDITSAATDSVKQLQKIVNEIEKEAAQVNPRVALCPMQTENVSIDVNVIEYPITEPFHDMVLPRQMLGQDQIENVRLIEQYSMLLEHDAIVFCPPPACGDPITYVSDGSLRPTSDANSGDSLGSNYNYQSSVDADDSCQDPSPVIGMKLNSNP